MKKRKKARWLLLLILLILVAGAVFLFRPDPRWKQLSSEERQLRLQYIEAAESWLGCSEADGSHKQILDLYNSHTPLAQGYRVQYTDSWCAAFVSAAAIASGLTDIIPTECGCQRQIGLFQALGRWEERDDYRPLPGDIIYYCRSDKSLGDCTGWADHVGIVTQVNGSIITVLEGNYDDCVQYRHILINAPTIRGFGLPDYSSLT